ncbi:cell cycle checkpoint protein RAD1 [Exaiptasia diaphana]|uniref:Cell cycle checkpoint protein RAD1 n=1 Tax=Exaiptasia diaphana TaxID=2652724 RepID=A0A913WVE1_EXADI|nr:cell cycle checkpoint protein RAD1 [Exaiptasia diaphana]KXJ27827.1 Cell cycle checkpoint protein RAD1 [Exaiptasia diaphana]
MLFRMSRLSQFSQQSGDESPYILVAKLDNARNMSNILKAVHFKDSATCFVSSNGIKVTVENAKCVQANAFIQSNLFQEYTFKEESATFRINLNVLMECLNIFGSSKDSGCFTTLKLCYKGYGFPLVLMLEEGGVLTDCSIQTEEPDETLDFDFSSANVLNKIIMKSECLREAFDELDMTSEVLQILMSPDNPYFRLSTFGYAGSTHSDFPKDCDMVESFECEQTQTNRYKINLLKPSTKALHLSSKISIRMDDRGFLSLQYMIVNDDGQVCFVEYLCAPDEEMEDDEDEVESSVR